MGGNAAEAHPCGFKWVTEAKAEQRRQADRGRPALHAVGLGVGYLRAASPRHRHRLPVGRDALPADQRQDPPGVRQGLHQRLLHRQGGRLPGRAVRRLRRGAQELRRPLELGLRVRRAGHGQGGRDAAAPALRHQPAEGPCRALHARDGRAHHRHAEGQVRLRADRHDGQRRALDDVALCAGLDATHHRRTEHPRDGDDPAPAGQHGRAGWRRERAARPFQRAGHHRPRAAVDLDAGLPGAADGKRSDLRRLHEGARLQADPARPASGRTTASSSSASRRVCSVRRRPRTTTGPTIICPSSTSATTC